MTILERLQNLPAGGALSGDEVFDAIAEAGSALASDGRQSELPLEISVRLLEAKNRGLLPEGCIDAVDFLVEECGLYPYIKRENLSYINQTLIEGHKIEIEDGLYLHSEQMQILLWLMQGDNVILSAPTSFGKSLLVDSFISKTFPCTVVCILPTIALIDEFRRRLSRNFGQRYKFITSVTDHYDSSEPTIFVLTQERFLQRDDDVNIDLLFIDEFYKLDPERKDDRYQTLNLALYRALPRAKQCFMAGPHISAITLGSKWSGDFRFVRTDYRTVSVNSFDRSEEEDRFEAFLNDLRSVAEESSLIFTASPRSSHELLAKMLSGGIDYPNDFSDHLAVWIAQNYHPDWSVCKGIENGCALHHGRVPRSLAQLFVHLFDEGHLRVMLCTSTLIEGVNTSAANVFVYDKKINRTDFDFFSFANIRGRVGRMMRHFVGNVFLYYVPPHDQLAEVDVPILAHPDDNSDFLLINTDVSDLSATGRAKQSALPLDTGLSVQVLREHGDLGTDNLVKLSEGVDERLATEPDTLLFSGFPNREQRVALAELCRPILSQRKQQTARLSAKQIGWAWSQLNQIRSFPKFLSWFSRTFAREEDVDALDSTFQFLSCCEFLFPRIVSAIQTLVNEQLAEDEAADYGPFILGLENTFRAPWMKQLDEHGLPLPLSERLKDALGSPDTREQAIERLRGLNLATVQGLSKVDEYIIRRFLEA